MGIPGDDHPDVLILIDLGSARRMPSRLGQLGVNASQGMRRTLLSSAATDLGSRYPSDQRGETYRAFRAVVRYFLRWVSGSVEIPSIDDVAGQNDVPTPGIGREAGVPLVPVIREQLAAVGAEVDDFARLARTCPQHPGERLHPTHGCLLREVQTRHETAIKSALVSSRRITPAPTVPRPAIAIRNGARSASVEGAFEEAEEVRAAPEPVYAPSTSHFDSVVTRTR